MAAQLSNGRPHLRGGRIVLLNPGQASPVLTTLILHESHQDYTVYQRSRDNTARVRVSGTYSGEVPASIQARTVKDGLGAQSLAWADLSELVVDGDSFVGFLVVPKSARVDMHRLQARAGASQPIADSANRFAVGIRVAMSGQSNMVGIPDGAYKYPLGAIGCFEHRGGSNKRVGNINDAFPPNTLYGAGGYSAFTSQGKRGDGYVYIANQIAMATDTPVCVYEQSSGGTPISGWTGTTPNAWNNFVAGMPSEHRDFEIFLWYQGESNARGTSTAAMLTELGKLHGKALTLTGRNAESLSMGLISLGSGSYGGSLDGEFGNMRAAHVQFASSTPGAFLAAVAHDCVTTDGVHLTGASHGNNGARAGLSIAARLGFGKSGAGPKIVSATRAGLIVTIQVAHSGGTTLVDGAGGAGTELRGFAFADSSGAIAYNASSIEDPNTIKLTLAAVPVGALAMSYAMMNNPHNTDPADSKSAVSVASIPCDNVVVLGSPYGCPLQPCAPINVTGG